MSGGKQRLHTSLKANFSLPLGFGSNFSVLLTDDRRVLVWGEFKAGNLRTRSTNGGAASNVASTRKRTVTAASELAVPLFSLTKTPRELEVPTRDERGLAY